MPDCAEPAPASTGSASATGLRLKLHPKFEPIAHVALHLYSTLGGTKLHPAPTNTRSAWNTGCFSLLNSGAESLGEVGATREISCLQR